MISIMATIADAFEGRRWKQPRGVHERRLWSRIARKLDSYCALPIGHAAEVEIAEFVTLVVEEVSEAFPCPEAPESAAPPRFVWPLLSAEERAARDMYAAMVAPHGAFVTVELGGAHYVCPICPGGRPDVECVICKGSGRCTIDGLLAVRGLEIHDDPILGHVEEVIRVAV